MIWNGNCHLVEGSRLEEYIKNGYVVGFALSDGSDTRVIKVNDRFICLEELPNYNRRSSSINFIGLVYFLQTSSYMFCYMSANLKNMDFRINGVVNSCEGKNLSINPFVEPKRMLPYTYVVYDNQDFKNARYNGDMCLLRINTTSSIMLPIESNIRNYFKDTELKLFDIKIIPLDRDAFELAISLGDKRGYTQGDTIYFYLRIISTENTLDYEVSNIFTYRGDNYSLVQRKQKNKYYLGKVFFRKFIISDFMYNLVIQEREHKRRLREIVK